VDASIALPEMGCKEPADGSLDPDWPVRVAPPALRAGDVHVWAVPLDVPPREHGRLRALLSDAELARAQRLVPAAGRARFTAARGALRTLLGAYTGAPPGSLTVGVTARGKPFLEGPAVRVRFNLAHSEALAVVAVAHEEVGVDVERQRVVADAAALAARYLAPQEARELAALPTGEQAEAFLRCWTLKEAVLKATGEGLSRALGSFRVGVAPGEPARLLDLPESLGSAEHWSLHELEPAQGYLGAVAVRSRACRLRCFTLRI
jgi:4'-phosphopantetheinyl transferase